MNVPSEEQLLAALESQQREDPFGQMVRLYVDQTLRDRQPAPVQTPGSPLGRGPAAPGS